MQQSETNEEIKVGDIVEVINGIWHCFEVGSKVRITGFENVEDGIKYECRGISRNTNNEVSQILFSNQIKKLPICKS